MFYYKQVKDGKIISVEAKSKAALSTGFVKTTRATYDAYLASLPPQAPPKPKRDLAAEINELKAEVAALKEAK